MPLHIIALNSQSAYKTITANNKKNITPTIKPINKADSFVSSAQTIQNKISFSGDIDYSDVTNEEIDVNRKYLPKNVDLFYNKSVLSLPRIFKEDLIKVDITYPGRLGSVGCLFEGEMLNKATYNGHKYDTNVSPWGNTSFYASIDGKQLFDAKVIDGTWNMATFESKGQNGEYTKIKAYICHDFTHMKGVINGSTFEFVMKRDNGCIKEIDGKINDVPFYLTRDVDNKISNPEHITGGIRKNDDILPIVIALAHCPSLRIEPPREVYTPDDPSKYDDAGAANDAFWNRRPSDDIDWYP